MSYEPLEIVLAAEDSREVFGNPPRTRKPGTIYKGLRVTVALVRDSRYRAKDRPSIRSSSTAYAILAPLIGNDPQESFNVIMVDARGRVAGVYESHRGTLHEVEVVPADVLRPVLVAGVPAFIVAHNHPSGDPEPSEQDLALTRRLQKAAEILGVQLLDHIVIGEDGYVSFADRRLI